MVMVEPLLLLISMPSVLEGEFVSALSETDGQIGSDGATDVAVGVAVHVGVCEGVNVIVGVRVRVKVGVMVAVKRDVLVRVSVGPPGVLVGGIGVSVAGRVGVLVKVESGRITGVYVGGSVGEAVRVTVGVSVGIGVDVMALWISACACASLIYSISSGVQYSPIIVQAIVSSSPVIASGSEGPLIDSLPFAPPS